MNTVKYLTTRYNNNKNKDKKQDRNELTIYGITRSSSKSLK